MTLLRYPECHPESGDRVSDLKGLKTKVDSGAEVLVSQLFFENSIFYDFRERCSIAGIDVPVIADGIPGIHLYTMNNPKVAKRICDGIRNIV